MSIPRMLRGAIVTAALMLFGPAALPAAEPEGAQEGGPLVAAIEIDGAIGPATSDYVSRSLEKAQEMGAVAAVLTMDTPGGLSSAMRDIIRDIITAPFPVITYVSPGGARAASAGTYILYASHVAAMAPGTNLGAATPVPLSGPMPGAPKDEDKGDKGKDGDKEAEDKDDTPDPKGAAGRKAINDAKAYIRSLAQMRGRNAEWAEKAVTEAASLSAEEALKERVIDLIAETMPELLEKADGRVVKVQAGEVKVSTKGATVREIAPDWRTELLAIITNPNIAYILLLAGIYGIIFEFYNPNMFSGVVGAICLLLALYALHVLPVNYAGLALIILGILFMSAEAFMPSFGALGFGGLVALVIGSIILIDTDAPGFGISWAVIGTVVATSATISLFILAMAARAWRRPVVTGREALAGAPARVVEWSGTEGRVRVRGELWRARSEAPLEVGSEAEVTGLEGLTLSVRPRETAKGTEHGHGA